MTSRHIINILQITIWLALGSMAGWAVSTGHKIHWLTLIMAATFIVCLASDRFDGKSLTDLITKTKHHDKKGN